MDQARRTRFLLYALFFLSGTAGLIYQIVWTRMLVLVFGNTLLAISTVLSAFMGGLAAGSLALGVHIDRRPRALIRLYAVLEAGIGLYALAFPLLLAAATPLYAALYGAVEGNVVVLNLVRFAVCFALILVPTFLMGGTLPVLLKRFAGPGGALGRQTGFFYGLNTAGAVAGTLACGYLLLRVLGLQLTTWVAVALNLGVAAVAWWVARREGGARPAAEVAGVEVEPAAAGLPRTPPEPVDEATPPAPAPAHGPSVRRAVLVGIGLSGFCGLAYEVLWSRMLNLFVHNNIYSFTAILATFLVGIALGSLAYSRFLAGVRDQVPLFAGLQVGIGVVAYATPFLFSVLLEPLFSDFAEALTLVKTAVIMLPPTLLMGAAVPMAVHICQRGAHREGTSVGTVYAVNTVGSILGAFLAGFVLLPAIGLQAAVIVVASLNVAAGVLPALVRARPRRRPLWLAAGAAVVAGFVLLAPPQLFRHLFERSHPSAEILHYKEGRIANVVVYDFQKTGYKDLHLNAVEEASSRLWHVQLFKLLGILPPMLHDEPTDALMVAFGAGMSAGAAAQQVDELRCVDLNPDIEGVGEVFRRENLDVLHNPSFRKVVNDGRNALLLDPRKYSLIISDATNPKMFDSWTLYSREFYELVDSRLAEDGIFAQWVLIPLPGDSIQVILNTFRGVFPHASFWCIYGSSQCLMLATPERLEIDYRELASRLEPDLGSSGLREFGVDGVEKFLSFFLLGEDGLAAYLDGFTRVNTDDLPHAQFHVEQDRAGIEASVDLVRHRESILPYVTNAPAGMAERMAAYGEISRRLNLGFINTDPRRYREARKVSLDAGLDDANVRTMLHWGPEKKRYFQKRVAEAPDDANAHNTLGFILWQEGDLERAEEELRIALELDPTFPTALTNLARLLVDAGRYDAALERLEELRTLHPTKQVLETVGRQREIVRLRRKLAYEPESPALHRALGVALYNDGRILAALDAYRRATEFAPRDPQILFNLARILERHEFVDEAAAVYDRLAELAPGDPRVRASSAELAAARADAGRRAEWLNERMEARWAGDGEAEDGAHPETCDRALDAWHDAGFMEVVDRSDLRRAAELYEESTAAAPDDLHAWVDAALLRELLGQPGRAAELWRGAAQVDPEWPAPALHAERLELLQRLEEGGVEPAERAELLRRVGALWLRLGEPERALEPLERSLELAPDRAPAWLTLARALRATGRYPRALAATDRALALDPALTPARALRRELAAVLAASAAQETGPGSRAAAATRSAPPA